MTDASFARGIHRIDMVSEHASPLAVLGGEDAGGQNVVVAELATRLARRGAEVVVHTRRDSTVLPDRVELAPGVTVHHVAAGPPAEVPKDELFPYMDTFADGLAQVWAESPPDVVHSHFWMSGYAAVQAAQRHHLPVAHTFHALGVVKRRHQGAADTSPPNRLAVESQLLHSVDRVIATCQDEVRELVDLGADPNRISVVPCGVDHGAFTPKRPIRHDRLRVLSLGRLVPRKGVDDVIRAVAAVRDVELTVAGGPTPDALSLDPEVCRLSGLAERLGVADRVRFVGRVAREEVPQVIAAHDLAVCVPWYEPFGIVPIEIMASGRPVVVSAVGGLVDSVVDEVTGLVVPPRNPAALARSIARLAADPLLRHRLGTAGAARGREQYSWDVIAEQVEQAYQLTAMANVSEGARS